MVRNGSTAEFILVFYYCFYKETEHTGVELDMGKITVYQPTYIHESAKIGKGTKIGAFCDIARALSSNIRLPQKL